MRPPLRNKLVFAFFSWYISRIIGSDFSGLRYNEIEIQRDRPILLLANHFSWWDGFVMFQINKLYFQKKFHVMITEENYEKVWFLKYMGSFSVNKNSRSVLESLEFAGKLLDDPENLVLIFPQGKLYSGHVTSILFQKGLMNMINSSARQFQYIFAATFVDYFEKRKPGVNCYLATWEGAEYTSLQLIKSAFNKHYETSREQQVSVIT